MLPFGPALLIIPVVLLVIVTLALARRKTGRVDYPYVAAPGLFTPAEQKFLRALEQALPDYRVFAKVRVADLITVRKGLTKSARASAFNRVAMKHVDFVLCRTDDLTVICAVELDDKTHERRDRRARDAFLERAFAAAQLPLVRVQVRSSYDAAQLRSLFATLETPKAA